MTPYWTVMVCDVSCGSAEGQHTIPAGEPVRVGAGVIRRCAAHAPVDVDWAEVDAAKARLEAAAAEALERGARQPTPSAASRFQRTRPLRSSEFVRAADLFDPKALAAGEPKS